MSEGLKRVPSLCKLCWKRKEPNSWVNDDDDYKSRWNKKTRWNFCPECMQHAESGPQWGEVPSNCSYITEHFFLTQKIVWDWENFKRRDKRRRKKELHAASMKRLPEYFKQHFEEIMKIQEETSLAHRIMSLGKPKSNDFRWFPIMTTPNKNGGVLELEYGTGSNPVGGNTMRVRISPPLPFLFRRNSVVENMCS